MSLTSKDWREGMVSIKHCTILHGVDSARPIGHRPIVHENNRAPYGLNTPPIWHRLDCAWIDYAKIIRHQLDYARNGYAKTIRHQLDCTRISYAQTPGLRPEYAPLQLCTAGHLARLTPSYAPSLPRVSEWIANNRNWNLVLIEIW